MTNPNLTLIAILMDRSGSMVSIKDDTEGGLKTFINAQIDTLTDGQRIETWLSHFDHVYENVYKGVEIREVPEYSLVPRGGTALVDSFHRMIVEVGESLAARSEDERPGKVVFVTLTDGYENASREVSNEQLKTLIQDQESTYSWEFIFLGANIDAVSVGGSYGIKAGNAITYGATKHGVDAVFKSSARSAAAYCSGDVSGAAFTNEERALALDASNVSTTATTPVVTGRAKTRSSKGASKGSK